MDFSLIFHPVVIIVGGLALGLMLISIVIPLLLSAWFKGVVAECVVNMYFSYFLKRADYHLMTNVTLPSQGGTTQIDHILISKYGVFVVESKNFKGFISGDPYQKVWIQHLHGYDNPFQNPLHQNYKHTRTLEDLLGLQETHVFSVVVFLGRPRFKNDMPENVTTIRACIRWVKAKKTVLFSNGEVAEIKAKIALARLRISAKTRRVHTAHVKAIVAKKVMQQPCPQCGSAMLLREVKKDRGAVKNFLGCSTFPKCRGSLNI